MNRKRKENSHQSREQLRELCNEIKSRIDYRAFYARFCPHARFTLNRAQTLCPIPSHAHSGTGAQSLSIDLKRGLFHCFSRDEGGDAIRFYELVRAVSFSQAVREIAAELSVNSSSNQLPLRVRAAPDVDETHAEELLDNERKAEICESFLEACRRENQDEGFNYLQRRGIKRETCERMKLAYFPRESYRRVMRRVAKDFPQADLQRSGLFNSREHLTFYHHRLLFPFYTEGQATYLQARATSARIQPRWHNMRGSVPSLYNADRLDDLTTDEIVYLVEGFTDTLTLLAHGFNAVGLVGAGGLREEWLPQLARFQIVSVLDPDAAGRRASKRYREMFESHKMQLMTLALPSDVNDYFRVRPSAGLELELMTESAIEKLTDKN